LLNRGSLCSAFESATNRHYVDRDGHRPLALRVLFGPTSSDY